MNRLLLRLRRRQVLRTGLGRRERSMRSRDRRSCCLQLTRRDHCARDTRDTTEHDTHNRQRMPALALTRCAVDKPKAQCARAPRRSVRCGRRWGAAAYGAVAAGSTGRDRARGPVRGRVVLMR